ncbi:hypothetical protein B834_844 [Enterococcus mundtii 1A]|nr:hypothetical protein [Enterococcus mundtii 1A]
MFFLKSAKNNKNAWKSDVFCYFSNLLMEKDDKKQLVF